MSVVLLHNSNLELWRDSESFSPTSSESLLQLGDALFIRSEIQNMWLYLTFGSPGGLQALICSSTVPPKKLKNKKHSHEDSWMDRAQGAFLLDSKVHLAPTGVMMVGAQRVSARLRAGRITAGSYYGVFVRCVGPTHVSIQLWLPNGCWETWSQC